MGLADSANFSGIIKHIGGISGSGPHPGVSFNNRLLNTVKANSPVQVGMGNALKIFIIYELVGVAFTKVTVNLFWIQRTLIPGTLDVLVPSGAKIARRIEGRTLAGEKTTRDTPFFDVVAAQVASGSPRIDDREVNWQVINLPLVAPPVANSVLPVTLGPISTYDPDVRGVVYECKAKTDELFFVTQTVPDLPVLSITNGISVEVAVGGEAQGDQK